MEESGKHNEHCDMNKKTRTKQILFMMELLTKWTPSLHLFFSSIFFYFVFFQSILYRTGPFSSGEVIKDADGPYCCSLILIFIQSAVTFYLPSY